MARQLRVRVHFEKKPTIVTGINDELVQFYESKSIPVNDITGKQIIDGLMSEKDIWINAPTWFVNNNANWFLSGHLSELEFVTSYINLVRTGVITFGNSTPISELPIDLPPVIPPVVEPPVEPPVVTPPIIPPVVVPDVSELISSDMVSQSVGFFQVKDGRITGAVEYVANSSFNSFYYGKVLVAFVQFIDPVTGKVIGIKTNEIKFWETERDERIEINEGSGGLDEIKIQFFVVDNINNLSAFADAKFYFICFNSNYFSCYWVYELNKSYKNFSIVK